MREAIQSLMSNWAFSRGRPCPGHFVSTFSGGEAIRHWIVSLHGQFEGTKQISPQREAQMKGTNIILSPLSSSRGII